MNASWVEPFGVTEVGLNVTEIPAGQFEQDKDTFWLNPPDADTDSVAEGLVPGIAYCVGLEVSVKSGVTETVTPTFWTVCATPPTVTMIEPV